MTAYILGPARYAKGQVVIQPRDDRDGMKGRVSYLCDALNARWVGRSNGYTLSPAAAGKFERLYAAGFDARTRVFHDTPIRFYRDGGPDLTLAEALRECGS